MWLDILGIILPVLATIVTAVIAKNKATRELKLKFEHLQKQWEHERELAAESRFSAMAASVSRAANTQGWQYRAEALAQVSSISAESTGNLAVCLDALYSTLRKGTREKIEAALSSVIQLKRNDDHQERPE